MRVQRRRNQNPFSPLLKILLSLVVIVAVSFCLAWVWHTTELSTDKPMAEATPVAETAPVTEPPTAATIRETAPADETETEPATDEESSGATEASEETGDGEEPSETAPRITFDGAVPESPAVDAAYFDDAIFIGDSISTGIPLYHIADNAAVVAMTGINTDNINYKKCIDVGGEERVTMLEAAALQGQKAKVYIMLGGNGIGYDKETFIAGYRTFLTSVKELYPDAAIYLQSMTPVVEGYVNEFDPTMNNDKIDAYNLEIMRLAKQESVYYLDVASALKNERGALPTEASPVDGLHFSPEYYAKWFDYLKKHTVQSEGN